MRRYKRRRRFGGRTRVRRRTFRRRYFRRGRGRRNTRSKITWRRLGTVDPDSVFVKLKYTFYWDDSAATGKVNYIRGNGPYDPDNGIGGSQPVGYDQYAALYQKQITYGSKVRIMMVNQGTNAVEATLIPQLVAANTVNDPLTAAYSTWKIVPPTATAGTRVLKSYMSTKKMYAKRLGGEDNFASATNSLPVNQWWWMFLRQDTSLATNITMKTYGIVTYYIKFYQKVILNDA